MTASERPDLKVHRENKTPSEEFAAYCELEFERRLNSGKAFDEAAYRKAMGLVLDRLDRLALEGKL
jgi:hypothetical protein